MLNPFPPKPMKKPHPFLLVVLAALAGCSPQKPVEAIAPTPPVEPAPIQVHTKQAGEAAMPRYLRVTGQLKGSQEAMVAADAAGKVVAAPIERGTVVKAGDLLIKLDDRSAALALKEAEAAVATSQIKLDWTNDELKRNEPLAANKAISDTDFERLKNDRASAEAGLAAAVARRDSARKMLDDTSIRSPFAGIVSDRLVNLGEYVRADSQVAHLVEVSRLHLLLSVPEPSVGLIKDRQAVIFQVAAYPTKSFNGKVKFIGASVRETARDMIVEAEVDNADGKLKPGMFGAGQLDLGEERAVVVPSAALRIEGTTRKVFAVVDGRIEERLVEIGEAKGDLVEIRRGVKKGDTVVLSPQAEAADGMKVAVAAQP